jgi:hypothetical protein
LIANEGPDKASKNGAFSNSMLTAFKVKVSAEVIEKHVCGFA